MLKAEVSSKIKGSIVFPTVGKKPYVAGDFVTFTEEQYYAADIQNAINKEKLIMRSKLPKAVEAVYVYNIINHSVVLPKYGVLRPGTNIAISSDDWETPAISKLAEDGKITNGIAPKKKIYAEKVGQNSASPKSSPDEKMSAVVHKPKSDLESTSQKAKTNKGVKPKHISNDILDIENGEEPGEKDGIQFVDVEQNEKRVKEHPVLGKKTQKE